MRAALPPRGVPQAAGADSQNETRTFPMAPFLCLPAACRVLNDPATAQGAAQQAAAYAKEDGVDSAVAAFHRKLPLDQMLCEVSLMLPGSRAVLGRYVTKPLGVRVSAEVRPAATARLPHAARLPQHGCHSPRIQTHRSPPFR